MLSMFLLLETISVYNVLSGFICDMIFVLNYGKRKDLKCDANKKGSSGIYKIHFFVKPALDNKERTTTEYNKLFWKDLHLLNSTV